MDDIRPKELRKLEPRADGSRPCNAGVSPERPPFEDSHFDQGPSLSQGEELLNMAFECVVRRSDPADTAASNESASVRYSDGDWLPGIYPTDPRLDENAADNQPIGWGSAESWRRLTSEAIVGPDNRLQVTNTTNYPYNCICLLEWPVGPNQFAMGTGWLIAPQVVVTAAHCICDESGRTYPIGGYRVYRAPANRGAMVNPAGVRLSSCTVEYRRSPRSAAAYDFGVLILDRPVTTPGMVLKPRVMSTEELRTARVNVAGYTRADGPNGTYPRGTMWQDGNAVSQVVPIANGVTQLRYLVDTMKGTSGAPVMFLQNGVLNVIGIHNHSSPYLYGGPDNDWYTNYNVATLITNRVVQQLNEWIAMA